VKREPYIPGKVRDGALGSGRGLANVKNMSEAQIIDHLENGGMLPAYLKTDVEQSRLTEIVKRSQEKHGRATYDGYGTSRAIRKDASEAKVAQDLAYAKYMLEHDD